MDSVKVLGERFDVPGKVLEVLVSESVWEPLPV